MRIGSQITLHSQTPLVKANSRLDFWQTIKKKALALKSETKSNPFGEYDISIKVFAIKKGVERHWESEVSAKLSLTFEHSFT